MIRRISDGSLVRTLTVPSTDSEQEPRIIGDSIVQVSRSESNGGIDTLTTTDVESGTASVLHFPEGNVVGFGESWVLTCRMVESTNDCRIRLTTSAGLDTLVGIAVNYGEDVSSVDGDATRAVVATPNGEQWEINTVTGATTQLSYPEAYAVAGDRAFWFETFNDAGTQRTRLHWVKRDGTGPGSVVVDAPSYEYSFRAFGDRVALLRVPDDGDTKHQELRPVNLSTGALEPAVARSIGSIRSLPDGSAVVALGDTATGRVAVVSDGGALRTLFALSAMAKNIDDLKFSQGRLASTWEPSNEDRSIYFVDAKSGGTWTTAGPGGITPPVVDEDVDGFFDLSNDTILSDMSGSSSSSQRTYSLTRSSGVRSLTSWYGAPVLGHGALLVSRNASASGLGYISAVEVQDAANGELKETLPRNSVFALDRSWVWHIPNGGNVIHGKDTATGEVLERPFAPACATALNVISSRALVECDSEAYVVDLSTNAEPWKLPLDSSNKFPALGGTFVSWIHYFEDSDEAPVIKVAALGGAHETRTYGPSRGLSFPPGPTVVPDDSGAPRLAYADSKHQPRLLDLGWTDTTAPTLTKSVLSASILATPTTAAELTFAGEDDTSTVRFDIDYRVHTPASGYGSWVSPTEWDSVSESSVNRTVPTGTTTCFRARAVDAAGNVSPWGSSLCAMSPLDDRRLSAHGRVSRATNSKAMLKTDSVLRAKGASLTRTGQRFHQVYVTAFRGPSEGSIKVYVGKTYLGSISLKSSHSGYARFSVTSSSERVGELRLVSSSTKRARIDAIALKP